MSNLRNVEAFEKLVGFCSGYRGYNPGMPNLTIQSLTTMLVNAKQAMDDANVAKSFLDKESNSREVAFDALPKLASRVVYALAASGASDQTLSDAHALLRKVAGRKKHSTKPEVSVTTAKDAAPEPSVKRSRYAGFVKRADNFKKLVQLVSIEANYQPNESSLQVQALNTTIDEVQQLNTTVQQAQLKWSDKKMTRDKALYNDDMLVTTSQSVKMYVRSAYGYHSPEYKQVRKLNFNKPKS